MGVEQRKRCRKKNGKDSKEDRAEGKTRAGLEKGIGVTVKVGAYAGSTSNCLI